ncbi:uncharacterized protein RCH25_053316 [Pelodytes ibericus]
MDLVEVYYDNGNAPKGYSKTAEFLSMDEIYDRLNVREKRRKLHEVGKTMTVNIERANGNQFLNMGITTIPIKRLRHVTTFDPLSQILHTESLLGLGNLLFWSAEICEDDINTARQLALEKVQSMEETQVSLDDIEKQIGNSPAFDNSASRYGNFVFSFPLSEILSEYKEQHCGGAEPHIRMLRTDMYKQEIAHTVVIHSPDIDLYNESPLVPTLPGHGESPPFVYWREEDGVLCWKPESTCSALKLESSGGVCRKRECPVRCTYRQCYHVNSPWNFLVLAFHLPEGQSLKISKQRLLENLSACHPREPFMSPYKKITKSVAEAVITGLKEENE